MTSERYVYVFVRTDLPLVHQIIQSLHSVERFISLRGPNHGIPNIVLIGMPDVRALERVKAKLEKAQIAHYNWSEPDYDFGFTAIAATPDTVEQRQALRNYRVYSPGAERSACLLTQDGGANTSVAQLQSDGL